jgi:RNA polymerase sigma-70 factor (ECF subfamily)
MDEEALIQDAQSGDLEAFNRLVLAYQDLVYNMAYRVMGEAHSAQDATQEAFISAFKSIRRFRGGSFKSWLLRIVTNACYDELRRRKRRPSAALEDLEPLLGDDEADAFASLATHQENPQQAAERGELARAIQDCLNRLPEEFRVVAVLTDVQGYAYQEAAQILGSPLGTIKSRLARARARLQECLQGYEELLPAAFRLEDAGMDSDE